MPVEKEHEDEEFAGGEGEGEGNEEEAEEAKRKLEVRTPTKEEVRKHNVSHLPFRSWCPQCVAGRGNDDPHKDRAEHEGGRGPEVHFDYAFMRNEEGGVLSTVLVGRCRQSKFLVAHAVPSKGESEEWVVECIVRDLKKMGHHGRVLFRGDQERSLHSLFERVAEARGQVTVPEMAPKSDSRANGFAERAVQQFEEMMRVHKLALENATGKRLEIDHSCIPWLVEHAADVVNRYLVMRDGTTAYERVKGRKSSAEMHEFGHPVLHRVSGKVQGGVMSERWHEGLWVGKNFTTGEDLISMADGRVVRARSIKERPSNVRLSPEMLDTIVGKPWMPTSTLSDARPLDVRMPDAELDTNPEVEEMAARLPYRVKISKPVLDIVGYSRGCSKCAAMQAGDKRRTKNHHHSEACRSRVEQAMMSNESMKKAVVEIEERQNEWLARQVEQSEKPVEAPGSSGDRAVSHVRDMPVNPFVNGAGGGPRAPKRGGRRAKPRYDVAEL